nr:hypothetical protein [Rhodoferax sp.]
MSKTSPDGSAPCAWCWGDVDDAVQEALMVLARKLQLVRTLAAFSGWLFQGGEARMPAPGTPGLSL